ncbi:hypothetical protein [Enorma phocaeensis]|uniref:hypothetical protein n=1 Tax=Enorma phocaeensis TaxID=1871019 RepID=UPI0032098E4D
MATTMGDGHLGFVRCKEVYPPRTPRVSGRYLDRWVGVWENACNIPTPFERLARDLGEFWLLDQFFTTGIHGYVQSTAGVWLSESPVSFLESAVFQASYARHPGHVRNLEMKRSWLYQRLRQEVQGAPAYTMERLGTRAAVFRADLSDALFDVAHGMYAGDIPGSGTLRDATPTPPEGWQQQLGWTPPVTV